MATDTPQPRTAILSTSPATVTWASGQLFNGYAWFGLVLPNSASGYSYKPQLYNALRRQELPRFVKCPIVAGVIDSSTQLFWNNDIDPPGTTYVAYYLDDNNVLIAPASGSATPFSVGSATQVLTVPTLNVPAYTSQQVPSPQTS